MRDPKQDAADMAVRREKMLRTAFELFSKKGIEKVTMEEIAQSSGVGKRTLHRYFSTKAMLVAETGTWAWQEFLEENKKRTVEYDRDKMDAAGEFELYLDSFIVLFLEHRDLLRFNQFFNIYVVTEGVDKDCLKSYKEMIEMMAQWFHGLYEKGKKDNSLSMDLSEEHVFTTTLHLMMAVITRYAVGLVYEPEGEEASLDELLFLKEMLISKFVKDGTLVCRTRKAVKK